MTRWGQTAHTSGFVFALDRSRITGDDTTSHLLIDILYIISVWGLLQRFLGVPTAIISHLTVEPGSKLPHDMYNFAA